MSTRKSLAVATGLIALLVLSVTAGAIAQGGTEDVQQQIVSALARGDVAAALAWFSDDAVIDSQSGACTDKPCGRLPPPLPEGTRAERRSLTAP